MRLEPEEIVAIKAAVLRTFGKDVKLYLYGSRVDDAKRGGDIDLLIEAPFEAQVSFDNETKFRDDLATMMEERRIDILLTWAGSPRSTIEDIAYSTGVRIL